MNRWPKEKILSLRSNYGESQEDFARRFPVSATAYRNWEQGRMVAPPWIQTLLTIFEEDLHQGRKRELQMA